MSRHSIAKLKCDSAKFGMFVIHISLLFSALGFINCDFILIDLISHFRIQYLLIGILSLLASLVFRNKQLLFVGSLIVSLNLFQIAPYYISHSPNQLPKSGLGLRFMSANIFSANENYLDLIAEIKKIKPDFIVILELNQKWDSELKVLESDFPYYKTLPRSDNFGIGIYSKFPLANVKISQENHLPPLVHAGVKIGDKFFNIYGVHTLPPVSLRNFDLRNKQLRMLASNNSLKNQPSIVLGDLNTTMWSPTFRNFVKDSSLINSRKGFGVIPTWPTNILALQIPLDHALVSSEWTINNLYSVNINGSDHSAVVLEGSL